MGCEDVARHTKDAMWAADGYAELAASVAIALSGLSQLAQDLEILCSREFGAVELADAHSRQSDLMPQKKNPYALAIIRAAAAEAAGAVTAILTALHTGFGADRPLPGAQRRHPAASGERSGHRQAGRRRGRRA